MKNPARVGASGESHFKVEECHTIAFPGQGMPPVLSTPSLIWFLEHAAINVLDPLLEAGEASVGTDIELQHLAPTPLAQSVTCVARVVQSDGPSVAFQLEAHDEKELIARGYHRRRIIHTASFTKRLQAKTSHDKSPS
jgi:fluoroacetyl-CoA thioesterase